MELVSGSFFVLCVVAFLLHYLVPKIFQNLILLSANFVFAYYAGPISLVFLFSSIAVTYWCALGLERFERYRRAIFWFGIIVIFSCLFRFKYLDFFIATGQNIAGVFGASFSFDVRHFIAPIAISFYTLQLCGYLADVYFENIKAEHNILKFFTFGSFFPQLVCGPISRYSQIEPYLSSKRCFCYDSVCHGLLRILWGIFLKLVIAERAAVIVNVTYGDHVQYTGLYLIFGTVMFAVQLYADFGGCMHIVIGIAELFGIKLPENFRQPFFSKNVQEFWQRWHITMGTWLRDYIFYPLQMTSIFGHYRDRLCRFFGKKVGKKITAYTAMMVLWFSIGLWHGGNWTFIWGVGLMQGFYIIIGMMMAPYYAKLIKILNIDTETFSFRLFQSLRTFCLMCIAWVFFRAPTFTDALNIFSHMVTKDVSILSIEGITSMGLDFYDLVVLFTSIIIVLAVESLQQYKQSISACLFKQGIVFRWSMIYALIFAIVIFGKYGSGYNASAFIYAGF